MDRRSEAGPEVDPVDPEARQLPNLSEGTTRERLVYIPRERSCPLFSGTGEMDVRTWIEEVESIMRSRRLVSIDQAYFIYDHLIGDAREEIKYRPKPVREDPSSIFDILRAQYSCPLSLISLKEAFYARKQQEGESLREFSHALFSLMDKMIQSCPERRIPDAAQLLRDQFMECVFDGNLSRELRRVVCENPTYDLHDLRDQAIRWEREGRLWESKARSYSVPSAYSIQQTEPRKVRNDTVGSELAELKELLKQQQVQIDQLAQELRSRSSQVSQDVSTTRPRNFHRKGQIVCRRCQKPGHFAKDCDNERVVVPPARPATTDSTSHGSYSRQLEN